MANPNIVGVTSIYGKTQAVLATTTTAGATVLSNPLSSGNVYKVNTLLASNIGSTDPQTVNLWLTEGALQDKIMNDISIPANASLTLIDKSTSIYLEEGQTLHADSDSDTAIRLLVSYEEIG